MIIGNNKPYRAISFPTVIFNDLKTYMDTEGHTLEIISADDFLANPNPNYQYINLVSRDNDLRKIISKTLTDQQLDRFTFVHSLSTVEGANIGNGSLIYPNCNIMPGSTVEDDVIIFPVTTVAHKATIGQGTFIAGYTAIAGSTQIGKFCYLALSTIVIDRLVICDDVYLTVGSAVRKNITEPGHYFGNRLVPNGFDKD